MPLFSSPPPPLLIVRRGRETAPVRHVYPHGGTIDCDGRRLTVTCDLPAVDWFYCRRVDGALLISPDVRLLLDERHRIDRRGLLSMLLFGAPIPPLALFEGVETFVPGFRYVIDLRDLSIRRESAVTWPSAQPEDPRLDDADQGRILQEAIDREIVECVGSRAPVVLFSGGVDSGVLAARLRALDFDDTALVHYSFGPDSPDTIAARALAATLRLPLEIVEPSGLGVGRYLDHIPALYRQPFSDHSAHPTQELAARVVDAFDPSHVVLDGTGADGDFGYFGRWDRFRMVYAAPPPLRNAVAALHRRLRMWRFDSRVGRVTRIVHRCSSLPMLAAILAQHSFLGMALYPERDDVDAVIEALDDWVDGVTPGEHPGVRLPVADVALVAAGVFAQKTFSTFLDRRFAIRYPYLQPRLVGFAMRRVRLWPGSSEPKRALKQLLRAVAPPAVVDRPKSGFVSPRRQLFLSPEFLERLDAATGSTTVLGGILDGDVVRGVMAELRNGRRLTPTAYNFLWAVTVADSWIRGIDQGVAAARRRAGMPARGWGMLTSASGAAEVA